MTHRGPFTSLLLSQNKPMRPCHPEASGTLGKGVVSLPPDIQSLFSLTLPMPGPSGPPGRCPGPQSSPRANAICGPQENDVNPVQGVKCCSQPPYPNGEPELGLVCRLFQVSPGRTLVAQVASEGAAAHGQAGRPLCARGGSCAAFVLEASASVFLFFLEKTPCFQQMKRRAARLPGEA